MVCSDWAAAGEFGTISMGLFANNGSTGHGLIADCGVELNPCGLKATGVEYRPFLTAPLNDDDFWLSAINLPNDDLALATNFLNSTPFPISVLKSLIMANAEEPFGLDDTCVCSLTKRLGTQEFRLGKEERKKSVSLNSCDISRKCRLFNVVHST